MIRINLLSVERTRAIATTTDSGIPAAQRVTIGATLVLLLTVAAIGWQFWSLHRESAQLDLDITQTETEARNLRSVLSQVQAFEARKAQLQQRVSLIEQLRKGQAAPARVLDQISRSVPDRLWLTDLKQAGDDFTINGFALTMTALSDFVAGIEGTASFRKPVEIVDSEVTSDVKNGDLVRFVVRATYVDADAPVPPVTATAGPKK